jgi:hypothetical protein
MYVALLRRFPPHNREHNSGNREVSTARDQQREPGDERPFLPLVPPHHRVVKWLKGFVDFFHGPLGRA